MLSPVADCSIILDLSVPTNSAVIPVVPALELILVFKAVKSVVVTTALIAAVFESKSPRVKLTVPLALTADNCAKVLPSAVTPVDEVTALAFSAMFSALSDVATVIVEAPKCPFKVISPVKAVTILACVSS